MNWSELYERELIYLHKQGFQEQVEKEWYSRNGLPFPFIRTREGIIKYGEVQLLNKREVIE